MKTFLKTIIISIFPRKYVNIFQQYNKNKYLKKFNNLSNSQIFTKIYNENLWGEKEDNLKFNSGLGSRDIEVIDLYAKSIESYFNVNNKLDVLDFGCGDFFVGSRIRHIFNNYIAADIVPDLIEYNKNYYNNLGVNFIIINNNYESLPSTDMIIIRQVFQHMSNDDIIKVLKSFNKKYQYLLLTEHVPKESNIVWNIDKNTNSDIRLSINSGINLELAPFNLIFIKKFDLCEIERNGGIIKSILYKLF